MCTDLLSSRPDKSLAGACSCWSWYVFVFMTFAVPWPWSCHSHPFHEEEHNVFTWKYVLGFEKGLVVLDGKERFFFMRKGNASCCIPPPQLSFISNSTEMMVSDQSHNRQQQAIVKGSLKQGNDRVMPRHCLWWLEFQLLLHLALSPLMRRGFLLFPYAFEAS